MRNPRTRLLPAFAFLSLVVASPPAVASPDAVATQARADGVMSFRVDGAILRFEFRGAPATYRHIDLCWIRASASDAGVQMEYNVHDQVFHCHATLSAGGTDAFLAGLEMVSPAERAALERTVTTDADGVTHALRVRRDITLADARGRRIVLVAGSSLAVRVSTDASARARRLENWFRAAMGGTPATLRGLRDAGIPVDARNAEGQTALMHVLRWAGPPANVEWLLGAGADVNARDVQGMTPLMHSIEGLDQGARADRLIAAGAMVGARDAAGRTPLHYACLKPDAGSVRRLLAAGADINARDAGGRSPLAEALVRAGEKRAGFAEIAQLLRAAGASE